MINEYLTPAKQWLHILDDDHELNNGTLKPAKNQKCFSKIHQNPIYSDDIPTSTKLNRRKSINSNIIPKPTDGFMA